MSIRPTAVGGSHTVVRTDAKFDDLSGFLEGLQAFNTPGKLKNFTKSVVAVPSQAAHLNFVKQIEDLNGLMHQLTPLTGCLAQSHFAGCRPESRTRDRRLPHHSPLRPGLEGPLRESTLAGARGRSILAGVLPWRRCRRLVGTQPASPRRAESCCVSAAVRRAPTARKAAGLDWLAKICFFATSARCLPWLGVKATTESRSRASQGGPRVRSRPDRERIRPGSFGGLLGLEEG